MNPRHPTSTLTSEECDKLRALLRAEGEKKAILAVGLRTPETFYKAVAGTPISRLSAEVIRSRLDRI